MPLGFLQLFLPSAMEQGKMGRHLSETILRTQRHTQLKDRADCRASESLAPPCLHEDEATMALDPSNA